MPINLSYEAEISTAGSSAVHSSNNNNNNNDSNQQQHNYRTTPLLYINGHRIPPHLALLARPNQTLLDYLRTTLHLTGSKLGCGEGGCGACTVLLSRLVKCGDGKNKKGVVQHSTVNACLFPILAADGCHVTTVEGIGSWRYNNTTTNNTTSSGDDEDKDHLHPIQRAMVDMHGSQCGYCTPGIIMALYGLFAQENMSPPSSSSNDNDSNDEKKKMTVVERREYLEEHLDGNLCRCTGYRPIWDAARSLVSCHHPNDTNNDDLEGGGIIRGPCGVACGECPEKDSLFDGL